MWIHAIRIVNQKCHNWILKIHNSFFIIANLLHVLYLGVQGAVVGRIPAAPMQAVQAAEGPVKPVENRRTASHSSAHEPLACWPSINSNSSKETSRKQSVLLSSSLLKPASLFSHLDPRSVPQLSSTSLPLLLQIGTRLEVCYLFHVSPCPLLPKFCLSLCVCCCDRDWTPGNPTWKLPACSPNSTSYHGQNKYFTYNDC